MAIDLTGGEAKVIGNCGDKHLFRLSNPEGQDLISPDGEYEIDFTKNGRSGKELITVDISEIEDGILLFYVVISPGVYVVRRLEPRRTLLTLEVESR